MCEAKLNPRKAIWRKKGNQAEKGLFQQTVRQIVLKIA
jgi:hypothetical protein